MHAHEITIPLLTVGARKTLIDAELDKFGKQSTTALRSIVYKTQSNRAIYLQLVCEYLRTFVVDWNTVCEIIYTVIKEVNTKICIELQLSDVIARLPSTLNGVLRVVANRLMDASDYGSHMRTMLRILLSIAHHHNIG